MSPLDFNTTTNAKGNLSEEDFLKKIEEEKQAEIKKLSEDMTKADEKSNETIAKIRRNHGINHIAGQ